MVLSIHAHNQSERRHLAGTIDEAPLSQRSEARETRRNHIPVIKWMLVVVLCNDGHRHPFVLQRDQKAAPCDAWARFDAAISLVLFRRRTPLTA